MDVWLDHLTATLVAGVVILILAAVWYRGQVSAIATTNTYRDRGRIEVLRETIDRDMARLGAGVGESEEAILAYTWSGPTRTFEFQGQIASTADVDRIRYRATETACTAAEGTCWRLVRQEFNGTGYVTDGFDLEVESVEIVLTPAGSPSDATAADVRVILPSPELRPATRTDDPRRLPVSLDRHYRLVNQALRLSP